MRQAGRYLPEFRKIRSQNQDFIKPNWIGSEISLDKKYYNHYLSKNPYSLW